MNFNSIEEFKKQGFEGFISTKDLWISKCKQIPNLPGVYLVISEPNYEPIFLQKSRAGLYKGNDMTVEISDLEENWVPGSKVLYIGKAGGSNINQGLRDRLWKYIRTGFGPTAKRGGGIILWQLGGADEFAVCWKTDLGNKTPLELETELVGKFIDQHGKYPFANIDPKKRLRRNSIKDDS